MLPWSNCIQNTSEDSCSDMLIPFPCTQRRYREDLSGKVKLAQLSCFGYCHRAETIRSCDFVTRPTKEKWLTTIRLRAKLTMNVKTKMSLLTLEENVLLQTKKMHLSVYKSTRAVERFIPKSERNKL